MAIIRGKIQASEHFTIMPNHWLRDPELSLKAIGLLAQVLSHSEGWSMSINSLAKANNVGKDAIRTAIKELEERGYLVRQQSRNDATNRFEESIWMTSDPSEKPSSENPSTEKPSTENPTPKNTNTQEEQVLEEQGQLKPIPQNKFEVRTDGSKKHWDEFVEFYSRYPLKTGKQDAYRAFVKALKITTFEELMRGVTDFANDPNLPKIKSKIKHPATWLNKGCWDDEPLPPPSYTRDEILELQARRNLEVRKSSVSETKREILEQRKAAERVAAEEIPRCEHDRIWAVCPHCSRKNR
jgi:hypothetical protein